MSDIYDCGSCGKQLGKMETEFCEACLPDNLATPAEIAEAREMYGSDEINIDEGARASRADDGTWVAAWVWVPYQTEEG